MKVEYLPSFLKDLKALKSTPVFEQIKDFAFAEIPNSNDLQTVNLKKLKGDDAYRLRVGDYRIGFYFDGETVTFACFTGKIFIATFHHKAVFTLT